MDKRTSQILIKTSVAILSANLLMGATQCSAAKPVPAPAGTLARKIQLGTVRAPQIQLPAQYGGSFDFAFVASAQMAALLPMTKYFSTANVDPNAQYNGAGLSANTSNDFYSCTPQVPPNQTPQALVMQGLVQNRMMLNRQTQTGTSMNLSYYGSCMIPVPEANVDASINDFSLVSGGGVTVNATNMGALGGANFGFQNYSLQVEMVAKNPVDASGSTIAAALKNTYAQNYQAGLTLNLGPFSIGPSGYFNSDLSKVVSNGLTAALDDLGANWPKTDPWYATILKSCETYIYINGSKELGLQVGDIVSIKNVMYFWRGDVCASENYGATPDGTPVAFAQIVSLGDNISAAQVIKGNDNYPHQNAPIYPGARIYMHQRANSVTNVCDLPIAPVPPKAGAACTATAAAGTIIN
jgi:hypothetical protein